MKGNLYLVGYMGAGKSTVGAQAAKLLGRPFADLDTVIVEREGRSIPEIFAEDGEAVFRGCEQAALCSVEGQNMVIATGGGILTWPGNREIMEKSGVIVFLDRPLDMILSDLDTSGRPMAAGGRQHIVDLYHKREPQYRGSTEHHVLNTGTLNAAAEAVAAVAREVLQWQ